MFLELLAFYLTTGWSTSVCPTTPTCKGFPRSRCCCEWSRLQGKGREERRWQISRFLISTTTHHISRTLLSRGHHHHILLHHRLLLLLLLLSLLVAIIILTHDFGFLFLLWSCIEEEIIELVHLFRSDQEYQPNTHTSTHTYKHRERACERERERETHTHTYTPDFQVTLRCGGEGEECVSLWFFFLLPFLWIVISWGLWTGVPQKWFLGLKNFFRVY